MNEKTTKIKENQKKMKIKFDKYHGWMRMNDNG